MKSDLIGRVWNVPTLGRVSVVVPSSSILDVADATWPAQRGATERHTSWRWTDILEGKPEAHALVRPDKDEPLGFWCSGKKRPVQLPDGKLYRLDYVEVRPDERGGVLGTFMLGVISARALELGADGIVLAAFPVAGLADFYRRAGAAQACPRGWNHGPKLLPFWFTTPALVHLKEQIDGLIE